MLTTMLAKAAITIVSQLVTSTFLSKLMIEGCRAWSKKTDNPFDDRVVEAMAEALGVEPLKLKE